MNVRKTIVLLICLALTVCAPGLAQAETYVTSDIPGADILVNGEFTGLVTPAQVPAGPGDVVSLRLPGYEAVPALTEEGVNFVLRPQAVPEGETLVRRITVTSETFTDSGLTAQEMSENTEIPVSLDDAVRAVTEDTGGAWYVIGFAPEVSVVKLGTGFDTSSLIIGRRGRMTIDGGGRVRIARWGDYWSAVNIIVSDVRIIGMVFDANEPESYLGTGALQLRVPDEDRQARRIENVYVLGCTFIDCYEVGVATCGKAGFAGTEYGGPGTVTVRNLVFSGNRFVRTKLFSFAGAGDEDYNIIDGYSVCGNRFEDGVIGMVAGDAHTWYVYGHDGADEPGFSEHNVLTDVLVSGNSLLLTENTTMPYTAFLSVECANLGNRNNRVENVEIRNNVSRVTGGAVNAFASVEIGNADVTDRYGGMEYEAFVRDGMEHTDGNVMRNLSITGNDFETDAEREIVLYNVCASVGRQCGKDNVLENVTIRGNRFACPAGVVIAGYYGNGEAGECSGNRMSGVVFEENILVGSGGGTGVTAAGSWLWPHLYDGPVTPGNPGYAGSVENVQVRGNASEGFSVSARAVKDAGGIAADCTISDVTVG